LSSRGGGPGVGSGPPRAEQMSLAVELDVSCGDGSAGAVAVAESEHERVDTAPRLTAVGDVGFIRAAALSGAFDVSGRRARDDDVRGDARPLHLHTRVAVIDVRQMTPERAVLHAAGDREIRLRAGRCLGDPAPAG